METLMTAGQKLRLLREQLGLTIREVEAASSRIASLKQNDEFTVNLSRLSDFETKGVVPSIFRLFSLASIYKIDFLEMLSWYGLDFKDKAALMGTAKSPNTHRVNPLENVKEVRMPVQMDPSFNLKQTSNLGRLVEKWGIVPLVYLQQFADAKYSYAYIGSEDFTMYPILLPGSFVKIDENKCKVQEGMWRSEYERPIYLVESREGFACCWCALKGHQIVLQPHPLSPVPVKILRHPQEAEVIGQVVALAMNLDWQPGSEQVQRGRLALN